MYDGILNEKLLIDNTYIMNLYTEKNRFVSYAVYAENFCINNNIPFRILENISIEENNFLRLKINFCSISNIITNHHSNFDYGTCKIIYLSKRKKMNKREYQLYLEDKYKKTKY